MSGIMGDLPREPMGDRGYRNQRRRSKYEPVDDGWWWIIVALCVAIGVCFAIAICVVGVLTFR